MVSGPLVVTYNGEIYNYLELRDELEKEGAVFQTNSDTEVLLHGYRLWREQLPTRLTGMFSFAIADQQRETLFLARDRFGEKPLFVWQGPDYVAFSSELKPLTFLPDLPRRLDREALAGFLTLNFVPGSATLMEGVKRLPPAHSLTLSRRERRLHRYWNPPSQPVRHEPEPMKEFRRRFDRAVGLTLRSDVPVGLLLSGGIDSSLVAESACRQGRLSRAYVLDFGQTSYSEKPYAQEVCQRLGLEMESIRLGPESMAEFLDLVDHADDPLADSSALAYRRVAQLAGSQDKVVLGGDGGDELFGGYLTYQASLLHYWFVQPWPSFLKKWLAGIGERLPTSEEKVTFSFKLRRFLRAAPLATRLAHYTWNGSWSPRQAAQLVQPFLAHQVETVLERVAPSRFGGRLHELQHMDLDNYLPNDILTKADRMSMTWGLETRAPFLEHQLAEWALALPSWLKLRHGLHLKYLLREAARQTFGPAIADRPKQGFSIPIHSWIRGPHAAQLRSFLTPSALADLEFIQVDQVQRSVQQHLEKRRSLGFELWGLAVLSAWHHLRIARPPQAPPQSELLRR